MAALREFPPSPAIEEALLQVLAHDVNPKVRIEAIESLSRMFSAKKPVDPRLLNVLQDRVESETNDYIRFKARTLLQEVSQK